MRPLVLGVVLSLLWCGLTLDVSAKSAESCQAGQIATVEGCVTTDHATAKITAIIRTAMPKLKLKAVLAGFAVAGGSPVLFAEGFSMTGIPATARAWRRIPPRQPRP
jgi:hypothetical protein